MMNSQVVGAALALHGPWRAGGLTVFGRSPLTPILSREEERGQSCRIFQSANEETVGAALAPPVSAYGPSNKPSLSQRERARVREKSQVQITLDIQ